MNSVLDVSAAMRALQKTVEGVDVINALMNNGKVMAPTLYVAELSNALWKAARTDRDHFDLYHQMVADGIDFVDEFVDEKGLWEEALRGGCEQDHPVYDMFYAVLAKRNDAVLLTCDEKLRRLCEGFGVRTHG